MHLPHSEVKQWIDLEKIEESMHLDLMDNVKYLAGRINRALEIERERKRQEKKDKGNNGRTADRPGRQR